MEFTYPTGEYARQLAAYQELGKLSFSARDSMETVIGGVVACSRAKCEAADVVNVMIREYVETFERDPEALTPELAQTLEALQGELMDRKTKRNLDLGISFRLARILKDHYRRTGDLDAYVRALQDCVAIEIRLFANHTNVFAVSAFTEECLGLAGRLEDMGQATRTAFYVTLFRLCCTHEKGCELQGVPRPLETFLRIDAILRRYVDPNDPELLDAVASQGIAYNILLMFNAYCVWETEHGRVPDVERYRPHVERFAAVLREQLRSDAPIYYAERPAIESYLLRAEFHLGRISCETLLDTLTRLQAEAAENEDPLVSAARLARLNYYYLLYLFRFSGYDPETVSALSRERIREAMPRILQITRNLDNPNFNFYMLLFIEGASFTARFEDFSNLILEMTVYSDKALYIHTEMVRELSRVIFDHLIERSPDYFDGVAGHDTAYIRTHREELRALLDDCCMFHDIGKYFMLDIVENSMRRLTDEEFRIIQYHPVGFEDIYENWSTGDERLKCIHDCALTHHLWHDGSRGYPKVAQGKNRPLSDILAVADSLDAATDSFGRPYGVGKSLDELIGELRSGAGTRYGPEAVAALSDPEVKRRVLDLITEGRKKTYYRIYTGKNGSN